MKRHIVENEYFSIVTLYVCVLTGWYILFFPPFCCVLFRIANDKIKLQNEWFYRNNAILSFNPCLIRKSIPKLAIQLTNLNSHLSVWIFLRIHAGKKIREIVFMHFGFYWIDALPLESIQQCNLVALLALSLNR